MTSYWMLSRKEPFSIVFRIKGHILPSFFQDVIEDKVKLSIIISNTGVFCDSGPFSTLEPCFWDLTLLYWLLYWHLCLLSSFTDRFFFLQNCLPPYSVRSMTANTFYQCYHHMLRNTDIFTNIVWIHEQQITKKLQVTKY